MTLQARNQVLLIVSALTAVLLIAGVFAFAYGAFEFPSPEQLAPSISLYSIRLPFADVGSAAVVPGSIALGLLAVVSALIIRRYFRGSMTPTLFLFTLSVALQGAVVLRLFQIPVLLGTAPVYISVFLSRALYFTHFVGALCLFAAGIYAAGAQYTRIWWVLFSIIGIALVFVYVAPIDAFNVDSALLNRLERSGDLRSITGFLAFLTFLSFLRYSFEAEDSGGIRVPVAVLLVLVARDVLFYFSGFALHLGAIFLLAVGVYIFARNSYSVYLWT